VKKGRQVRYKAKQIETKEETMLIYVWNLSPHVEEDHFRQTFEAFGQVSFAIISSTVLKDRYTGESRGFGFVKMPDLTEAAEALKNLNRKRLDGHRMIVFGSSEN
jgi:RNA recognition motif-containing protein